jgi:hypothetical protein
VLLTEAPAVALAAMESGVAQRPVDPDEYLKALKKRLERMNIK